MKILYFDLSAILVLVVMIALLFQRKDRSNLTNKLLMMVYLNVLATTIFDLWSEAYNIWFLATETDSTFRYFLYYGYFSTIIPVVFMFLNRYMAYSQEEKMDAGGIHCTICNGMSVVMLKHIFP